MNTPARVAMRIMAWLCFGWIISFGLAQFLNAIQFVRSASDISWKSIGSTSGFILSPKPDALYLSYSPGDLVPADYYDAREGRLSVSHVSLIRWLEVRHADQELVRIRKLLWPTTSGPDFIPASDIPYLVSESASFYHGYDLRALGSDYILDGMSARIRELWPARTNDKSMLADSRLGWECRQWFVASGDQRQIGVQTRVFSGWPMRMLVASRARIFDPDERVDLLSTPTLKFLESASLSGGIVFDVTSPPMNHPGLHPLGEFTIPLNMMAINTAVNSVCLATFGFGVVAIPKILVAYGRRRSGRCPACGYDRLHETTGTCPECGKR